MKYLIALLILLSANCYGQGSKEPPKRTAVEEALLDSASKYEKIKIAILHLETAYEYRGKEIQDLREALRLSDLQNAVQKQNYEQQLADKPKPPGKWKSFWKGFEVGVGTSALLTVTLIAL
jgi:hypothetical protein